MALVIGVVLGIKIAPDSSSKQLPDTILLNYINCETSIVGVFFARLFCYIALMIIIWAASCKPFLCIVPIGILMYQAFNFGATSSFLISLYNIGGIINVLLVMIPSHLFFLLGLVCWTSVCMGYNFASSGYGYNVFGKEFINNEKSMFIVLLIIVLLACLYELIFLPWTSTLIIIK